MKKFYEIRLSSHGNDIAYFYHLGKCCMTILISDIPDFIELLNEALDKSIYKPQKIVFNFDEYINKRNALIEQERYEEVIELDEELRNLKLIK